MSKSINFEGSNTVMRAPEGAENVQDMHVFRTRHSCVSCWALSPEELAEINQTGRVFLSVLMSGQQPPVYVGSESTCREVMVDFDHVWPMAPRQPAPETRTRGLDFPRELTDDLRDVLSTMLWTSGQIARCLRAGGAEIRTRAEDEQAHVLHWLLCLALESGSEWRAKAADRIDEIRRSGTTTSSEGCANG